LPEKHLKKVDFLSIEAELKRKVIHLSCVILPLLYYFYLNREQIIILCSTISILFLIAEILRFRHRESGVLFQKIFSPLLREKEKNKHITGATYLFFSATVTFIIFRKEIAIPAVMILTIADSFAAIVGKMTDSAKFFDKSLAGSLTFFLISMMIFYLLVPELGWMTPVIAFLVTLIEALPLPINDNPLISLSTGFMLYLVV
jgi:dolichol kinase